MSPADFAGRSYVLRLAGPPPTAERTTLDDDIAFLREHGVRPIVVAPDRETARRWVRRLNRLSNAAVGLSGADAGLLPAGPARTLGVVRVEILRTLMDAGYVPVVEATALGYAGDEVAVDVDETAAAIASAVSAVRALFFHDAGGVPDPASARCYDELTPAEALLCAERAELAPGLGTALRAAARVVRAGVGAAQILDGRIAHAAIVELVSRTRIGTHVTGSVYLGAA